MLWNASALKGYAIEARDGRLGTVTDFPFDDTDCIVPWVAQFARYNYTPPP